MKALLIGGGGREHALAWKLRRDDPALELLAAPGNPGIADVARCIEVATSQTERLVALARAESVDLVIVGPEAPLADGIVDLLSAAGIPAFGPTRAAARIETSKRFAKELMLRAGVPTARASVHTDVAAAKRAAREIGAPVVVKASGLAAGKGVIVCASIQDADEAIDRMLLQGVFGSAGAEILVESFMEGEEVSVFALTDGFRSMQMVAAQDHKRLLDGDRGPNTGGMGSYAPVSIVTADTMEVIEQRIIHPVLTVLREHDSPFHGLLYAGLMLTSSGPMVVEFNCRFGDPETQAILPLMASSLLEPMAAIALGEGLAGASAFEWREAAAVATVLAVAGYPERGRMGDRIDIPDVPPGTIVFHAGTRQRPDGTLETAGGRVLTVTSTASEFDNARDASRSFAERIEFAGKQFRADIGWRESARRARAS